MTRQMRGRPMTPGEIAALTTQQQAYLQAKKAAQAKADETGFDWGLEWNEFEQKFHVFSLPAKDRRFGFELRCEVVHCSNADRIRLGHGP